MVVFLSYGSDGFKASLFVFCPKMEEGNDSSVINVILPTLFADIVVGGREKNKNHEFNFERLQKT